MVEELKYKGICLYCGDNFMSYRRTAKFDTPKCRKSYRRERNPNYKEGEQRRAKRYRLKKKRKQEKEKFTKLLEEIKERKRTQKKQT